MALQVSITNQTSNSITAVVSGFTKVPETYFCDWLIKKRSSGEYLTAGYDVIPANTSPSFSMTYTGLDPNTLYDIKVVSYIGVVDLEEGSTSGYTLSASSASLNVWDVAHRSASVYIINLDPNSATTRTTHYTFTTTGQTITKQGADITAYQSAGGQVSVDGLWPLTTYSVKCIIKHGTTVLATLTSSFTTKADPPAPPDSSVYLYEIEKTDSTITVEVRNISNPYPGGTRSFRWKLNDGQWESGQWSRQFSGLSPNTSYNIQVEVSYSTTTLTNNASRIFTTLSASPPENSVSLYLSERTDNSLTIGVGNLTSGYDQIRSFKWRLGTGNYFYGSKIQKFESLTPNQSYSISVIVEYSTTTLTNSASGTYTTTKKTILTFNWGVTPTSGEPVANVPGASWDNLVSKTEELKTAKGESHNIGWTKIGSGGTLTAAKYNTLKNAIGYSIADVNSGDVVYASYLTGLSTKLNQDISDWNNS